jgi:hypothetical protein
MRIPGLNLLNEDSTPLPTGQRDSLVPSLVSPPDSPKQQTVTRPSIEPLLPNTPRNQGINVSSPTQRNALVNSIEDSSIIRLETASYEADPLDIALALDSDQSSGESDIEHQRQVSEEDGYHSFILPPALLTSRSSASETDDDCIFDIFDPAQLGSLEGLDDEGEDLEDGAATKSNGVRTKNESSGDMGPINLEDVSVDSSTTIERLGTTERIMDTVAIVRAHIGGEYRILDEGAIVVTETRQLIGVVRVQLSLL